MLEKVDDIGADNPMAGNIYMAFVFTAIWKAADGAIDTDSYRIVVRNTITKSFMRKFMAGLIDSLVITPSELGSVSNPIKEIDEECNIFIVDFIGEA